MTDAEKYQLVVILLDNAEKRRDGMTEHGFFQAVRVVAYHDCNQPSS